MSKELVERLRAEPTASHFLKPAHLYQDLIAERAEAADEIERLNGIIEEMAGALETSRLGMNDWLRTYAPEMCGEDVGGASWRRMGDGVIAYVADVLVVINSALSKAHKVKE